MADSSDTIDDLNSTVDKNAGVFDDLNVPLSDNATLMYGTTDATDAAMSQSERDLLHSLEKWLCPG
jgi:hypothetical protein